MIAIIKGELMQRRWSTVWWVVGIVAFISLTLGVYPTFRNQADQLNQSLQSFPDSAKALFTDTNDFLSPVGYLSSQVYYLLLPLLFSFLAVALGSSLIAKEESSRTIELLLARPISRTTLVLGKAAAGLIVLARVGLAVGIIATIEVALIKFQGVNAWDILLVTLMALIMSTLFGATAFALTAIGSMGRKAAIGVATLIAFGSYLVSSLDKTVTWLQWPAKFLPFHYYHPADILDGHFTPWEALGMTSVIAVLLLVSCLAFRRRDIS
jgi:ABC-2 type transport system permease protein